MAFFSISQRNTEDELRIVSQEREEEEEEEEEKEKEKADENRSIAQRQEIEVMRFTKTAEF